MLQIWIRFRQAANNPRYALAKVDICNGPAMRALFEKYKPCAVMHLAAESHVDRSIDGPGRIHSDQYRRNLHAASGSAALLAKLGRACPQYVSPLACFDGRSVWFLGSRRPFYRNEPLRPKLPILRKQGGFRPSGSRLVRNLRATDNHYQLLEQLWALSFSREANPAYDHQRPGRRNAAGLRRRPKRSRLALCRGSCARPDSGSRTRPIGETYNIGGRNERSNLYVVEQICSLLDALQPTQSGDRKRLISFVTDRPGHDRRYAIDASKLERELGWRANESFELGLEKTVIWYRQPPLVAIDPAPRLRNQPDRISYLRRPNTNQLTATIAETSGVARQSGSHLDCRAAIEVGPARSGGHQEQSIKPLWLGQNARLLRRALVSAIHCRQAWSCLL